MSSFFSNEIQNTENPALEHYVIYANSSLIISHVSMLKYSVHLSM